MNLILHRSIHARSGFTVDKGSIDAILTDKKAVFYIAGLTPNSSRICQKFMYKGNFGDMLNNLIKHQNDMLINEKNIRPMYFGSIAKELISPKSTNDKVSPPLMSAIILAALNNTKYPDSLLATVIRRVKIDSDEENKPYIKLNDTRAGIIKACLNRKYKKEEITMSWNDDNKNPAYLCGGLFFKHDSAIGNAPAHILFDKIKIIKKAGVEPPRKFEDYDISIDKDMPSGVEFFEKI